MDSFNQKYKNRVDNPPYRVSRVILRPNDAVDSNVWDVRELPAAETSESGDILSEVQEADFYGPLYRNSSGYSCTIRTVTVRWEGEEEIPTVEPGEPRPPDWHPTGHRAAARNVTVVNAHRTWVENVRGTTLNSNIGRNR